MTITFLSILLLNSCTNLNKDFNDKRKCNSNEQCIIKEYEYFYKDEIYKGCFNKDLGIPKFKQCRSLEKCALSSQMKDIVRCECQNNLCTDIYN